MSKFSISEHCGKVAEDAPKGQFQAVFKDCLLEYMLAKIFSKESVGENK